MLGNDTVKVQADNRWGYRLIDKAKYDADPKAYKLAEDQEEVVSDEEFDKVAKEDAAQRSVQANRGVQRTGYRDPAGPRNADGTYDEPTPTDIRFPDKAKTEFANNLGAFMGRSAAGLRKTAGLEDAPGGIAPEDYKKWAKSERQRKRREMIQQKEARGAAAEAAMATRLEDRAKAAKTGGKNPDVEIPDDWEEMNWREKVKLAQEIQDDDAKLTKTEAEDIIRTELEAREKGGTDEGEEEPGEE